MPSVRRPLLLAPAAAALAIHPAGAQSPLEGAVERMGGEPALQSATRIRYDLATQWLIPASSPIPDADQPSYELHADLRDHERRAWRNTRRFVLGRAADEIVDVVDDTVSIRGRQGRWAALNHAYVDERREVMGFAPERVLLNARSTRNRRALPDTAMFGVAHARVAATIEGVPAVLAFRRSDGFLGAVFYRAAQPADFGLAPWGRMEVEVWYSQWRRAGDRLVLPHQWDVYRAGRPYKRVTVLRAQPGQAAMPDSFAVADSLRASFLATARKPMHDLALDSARLVESAFAQFGTPGMPAGAVRLGDAWLLLEAGVAPLNARRAEEWLSARRPGSRVARAVVSAGRAQGGVVHLLGGRVAVSLAPRDVEAARTVLRGHDAPGAVPAQAAGWLRVGADSVWMEPVDLPDAHGAIVVYVPSLRWMYSASAASPVHRMILLEHARRRGWTVERIGSERAVSTPVS